MGKDRLICNGVTYTGDNLLSGNCFIGNSIAGDELAIDTLTATVRSQGISLTGLPYGTPVFYYHGDTLIGKFYLNAVARSSRDNYDLSCVSGVGLLDALPHYGGLYAGETMEEVLADIIGSVVPYTVTPGIKTVRVYGWLPVATRRDNLRQLLFATGTALKKNTAGEISIELLNVNSPAEISDDRLLSGGMVEYAAVVSEVVVLEHGYIVTASDEEVTLYDESVSGQELVSPKGESLNGVLVTFDGPVYGLSAEGGTILESGVNYAILAPSGQTTLKGKKYTHTTREVYAAAEGATREKNVARVEDATLVNITNSEAVAKRVASYYSVSRKIRMGMVVGPERPGDAVILNDPFDEPATGLLMSQDINMSNTLVAQAEMIVGYVPKHEGIYENVALITENGSWTVPEGCTKIRVVVIGGGNGGTRGQNGTNGGSAGSGYAGSAGTSGVAGKGGSGGKVFEASIEVTAGQVIPVTIGAGGSANGGIGGETRFGELSSEDGANVSVGYKDIMTGAIYAKPGRAGSSAAAQPAGTASGAIGLSARFNTSNASGGSIHTHYGSVGSGGRVGASSSGNVSQPSASQISITSAGTSPTRHNFNFRVSFYAKSGYAGLSPSNRAAATDYGCGGDGGHGGGGGGGAAGYTVSVRSGQVMASFNVGTSSSPVYEDIVVTEIVTGSANGGAGGTGSAGGAGAPGCILIYY